MPALRISGTNRLLNKLRKDQEILEGRIAQTHRNIVTAMFTDLVLKTPQWSSALVQSWSITYTTNMAGPKTYRSRTWGPGSWGPMPGPYHAGMEPGVGTVLSRELPKVPSIRWNTKVSFVNTATYAQEVVEKGLGPTIAGVYHPLRPENTPNGKLTAVNFVRLKYGHKHELRKHKA